MSGHQDRVKYSQKVFVIFNSLSECWNTAYVPMYARVKQQRGGGSYKPIFCLSKLIVYQNSFAPGCS